MSRARRGAPVLLALIALLAMVAERSGAHGHALQESDLVPHSLMLVEDDSGCGPVTHLEAASRHEHPTCTSCALASSPSMQARPLVPLEALERGACSLAAHGSSPAASATPQRPARAPPVA